MSQIKYMSLADGKSFTNAVVLALAFGMACYNCGYWRGRLDEWIATPKRR